MARAEQWAQADYLSRSSNNGSSLSTVRRTQALSGARCHTGRGERAVSFNALLGGTLSLEQMLSTSERSVEMNRVRR